MAVTNTPVFPQKIQCWAVQILPADTTVAKTIVAGGANGSVIESINVSNTDAAVAYSLQFFMFDGTTNHLLATLNIPLSSGNTSAAGAVDVLRSGLMPGVVLDSNGNYSLNVPSGFTLKAAVTVTVTAAKVVDVVAAGSDF